MISLLVAAAAISAARYEYIVNHPDPVARDNMLAIMLLDDEQLVQIYAAELKCRTEIFRSVKQHRPVTRKRLTDLASEVKQRCSPQAQIADKDAASYVGGMWPMPLLPRRDIVLRVVVDNLIYRNLDEGLKDNAEFGSWCCDRFQSPLKVGTVPPELRER